MGLKLIALSLLFSGVVGAANACASLTFSHRGGGSNVGAWYRAVNSCPYNVFFQFRAGVDGTGVRSRDYNIFWPRGRNDRLFIYGPLPSSYRVVRQ